MLPLVGLVGQQRGALTGQSWAVWQWVRNGSQLVPARQVAVSGRSPAQQTPPGQSSGPSQAAVGAPVQLPVVHVEERPLRQQTSPGPQLAKPQPICPAREQPSVTQPLSHETQALAPPPVQRHG